VFSTDILYTMDIHHQLDRLRILKSLSHEESAHVYLALSSEIKTYDQINLVLPPEITLSCPRSNLQLLSALPVGHGGLTCLGLGLFHPYKRVRYAVADLLERIDVHPVLPQPPSNPCISSFPVLTVKAGQHFISALNKFQKVGLEHVFNERERATQGNRVSGLNGIKRFDHINGDGILPEIEDIDTKFDFEDMGFTAE
jgi:hypothetical protein